MHRNATSTGDHEGFHIASPAMKEVYEEIADYAFHGRSCVLFGPPGCGKEYVARFYQRKFQEARCLSASSSFYVAINCSGLSKDLAHSELFGHVRGAFSGATGDKKGLFEKAIGGVLFLDEIGDLDPEIQPMLNRALDPEYGQAFRLGATEPYVTTSVTVICATERPREDIRPSLLDRLEKQVDVPGLDQRPEDIPPAVEFFARRALAKRCDIAAVMECLFAVIPRADYESLMRDAHMKELSGLIAEKLLPMARARSWPGNFRALRIAIDTAVIRAKATNGMATFLDGVEHFFGVHEDTYSRPRNATPHDNRHTSDGLGANCREQTTCDPAFLDVITSALPPAARDDAEPIATFMLNAGDHPFRAGDLHGALSCRGRRTVQYRLKHLETAGIIMRTGGKGEWYRLVEACFSDASLILKKPDFLPLPTAPEISERHFNDVEHIRDFLEKSRRAVFVGGDRGAGKTTVACDLGRELRRTRPVYYYPFDGTGVRGLLALLDREAQARGIASGPILDTGDSNNLALHVGVLSGYVGFLLGRQDQPVLILDNVDTLRQLDERDAIRTMLRYWTSVKFVLVGLKLGNDLQAEGEHGVMEYHVGRAV